MEMKDGIYCGKCDTQMKLTVLDSYEYEESIPLKNVKAYLCSKCGNFTFTEKQAHAMRDRTDKLKEETFGFQRKVTISGKSLVIGIPSELADHLHIKQGQKVKIFPLSKDAFIVRAHQ